MHRTGQERAMRASSHLLSLCASVSPSAKREVQSLVSASLILQMGRLRQRKTTCPTAPANPHKSLCHGEQGQRAPSTSWCQGQSSCASRALTMSLQRAQTHTHCLWGQAQGCCPLDVGPARPAHISAWRRRPWRDPGKGQDGRGAEIVWEWPQGDRWMRSVPSQGQLCTLAPWRPWFRTVPWDMHSEPPLGAWLIPIPGFHVLWNPTHIPRG